MTLTNEIIEFKSLLNDFGSKKKIDPLTALQTINIRYNSLSKNLPIELEKDGVAFSDLCLVLYLDFPQLIHGAMYKGFLKNAGKFRRSSDPDSGHVYFGGYRSRDGRTTKFTGCKPNKIIQELENIEPRFNADDTSPKNTALNYYFNFVRIHPYYDGNGRIARLVVSTYLRMHGLVVNWENLNGDEEKKMSFIKKLNRCHAQYGQPSFQYRFNDLERFWNKFILTEEELLNRSQRESSE